jgi:myosin I
MGTTKAFIKTPETLFGLEHMRDRYWHNMAVRIQRAWRNYLRYRAEAATRIQRCWRKSKVGLKEIEFRDQGHRILQQRKERRRYSLLGSRRFFGDYLGLNMPGGNGRLIRDSIRLGAQERCVFSARCDLLVAKFGRSSKPMPRILVLTNKAIYIVVQAVINNSLQISSERTIPIGTVKFISTSTLRDDWFSIGIGSAQEPDPLLNCPFKTEFFLQFRTVTVGSFNLRIAENIEYNKKPGKLAVVKAMKDTAIPRDDMYKSGTIHVGPGDSPRSVSRPTPRAKAVARPITTGKLLRPGGPGGGPSKTASRPRPTPATQTPRQTQRTVPVPMGVNRPVAQTNGDSSHTRQESASSTASVASAALSDNRAPPPPPPPTTPSVAPGKPQARVKYDFNSAESNKLTITVGQTLEILQKEGNGKTPKHTWCSSNIS